MSKDPKLQRMQQTEDQELLKPPLPGAEFTRSDTWRVLRIQSEIVSGFDPWLELAMG